MASINSSRVRGDFLLSPLFLLSLILLLFNDLYLKLNYPGLVSGILSDFAGIVFFPIFLVAVAEFIAAIIPSKPWAEPSWFILSTISIAFLFLIMKYTAWGESVFVSLTESIRELIGEPLGFMQRGLVGDPLDLLALLLVPVPILFGLRVRRSSQ